MARASASPLKGSRLAHKRSPRSSHNTLGAREPYARYAPITTPHAVVVDTNVLIDVLHNHPVWASWSFSQLAPLIEQRRATIIPIVYAELSAGYPAIEALEAALRPLELVRENLTWEAAFLAGKAYKLYRKRGGTKRSPLPDFYIGAHASIAGHALLTRDPQRYREYFPKLKVIAPK